MNEKILVTGGTGFIGSHTVVELLQKNYSVIILDSLYNSSKKVLARIRELGLGNIPTKDVEKRLIFYEVNLLEKESLEKIFEAHKNEIAAVIHFAGLKAVGESVKKPLEYYHNNVTGTLHLLMTMRKYNVFKIVFSSSATVYGNPERLPITETHRLQATNPYGRTKLFIEEILRDLCRSEPEKWYVVILRYFNPVGAHPSGRLGEDPNGIPNNLMPYIAKVAIGKFPKLYVFGNDYPTIDGTGVRDYIHIVDLALGHIAALKKFEEKPGCYTYNLGTGSGYSVLQMVNAFERASKRKIPYEIAPRREGDVAVCYADPSLAEKELGWRATLGIDRVRLIRGYI
jgi:UDP-glucose 4-epimerase